MIVLQTTAPSDWAMFFGHFHPVVVHLPIGILMIAAILEYLSRRKGLEALQPAIIPILLWGTAFAIISCIFGWLLSLSGEYDENTLFLHQWMGIGVALTALAAWYIKKHWMSDHTMQKTYYPVLALIVILLTGTGHLGGNMTHGEDYLYAYTPEPFRSLAGLPPRKNAGPKKIENINEALVYQDVVAPIMEQKCWSCHNANKIKGGLRMDKEDLLMKGGEHGAIIKAGNPTESELLKRLLLPAEDEHHMPPKGKTPLTEQEIALVHWWIQNGGGFDKKVAQVKSDEKIKPILAALAGGGLSEENTASGESISAVFQEKVAKPDQNIIKKLNELDVLVMPVAKDQNFLEVNFVNAKNFNFAQINLLSDLTEQVIWLKLSRTQVTDKEMTEIAKMKNLVRLNLEYTQVSDVGIEKLQNMKYLEYINLVNTPITDAGLKKLTTLKGLKRIYCWQTKVTQAGIDALKKALPQVEVDNGWKETPVAENKLTK
ncbi:c-type cytochrome domain-containing protein [Flectobacillus major]|uniref:c-type cytochrome domain-containing protein n=1 Tax=Flectobacillus major TaxID=103 RepID=UPI000404935E|nr:c-type cytochrome domain-containing protein [Flectobacillus major]